MQLEPRAFNVVSACALPVRAVAWQDARGRSMRTIITKATLTLTPGESPLAAVQDELYEADGYWDDDEKRSLAVSTELVPWKRRADVVLVGHARAPGNKRVHLLEVRLLVGAIDKSIDVRGERAFSTDGSIVEGFGFHRMPLRWERAAGGPGTDNPVGVSCDGLPDTRGLVPLPNLFPPGFEVRGRSDFIPPVSFGPVAPTWPARRRRLHAGLARWDVRRWNAQPLPADLDPDVFNVAPLDQQTESLRANERIILENLHPKHPRLVTNLAAVTPYLSLSFLGGGAREVAMVCDTLWIDADRGIATLTWRGQLALDEVVGLERVVVRADESDSPGMTTMVASPRAGLRPVLPFVGVTSAAAAPREPFDPETTSEVRLDELAPLLPFREADPDAPPPSVAHADHSFADTTVHPEDEIEVTSTMLPSTVVLAPHLLELSMPAPRRPEPEIVPAAELPPPPPWIGPIPVPEPAPPPPPPEPEVAAAPPPEPAAPPPEAPLPLDTFPLERCAAIAASLARRPENEAPILQRHKLEADVWTRLHAHWLAAIDAELERGRNTQLTAYDKAYVASLEAERGPLTPVEMARVQLASERGKGQAKLLELDMPSSALPRIRRVWLGRVSKDDALGAAYRGALRAEVAG